MINIEIRGPHIENRGAKFFLYGILVRIDFRGREYWDDEMIPDWEIGQLLGGN